MTPKVGKFNFPTPLPEVPPLTTEKVDLSNPRVSPELPGEKATTDDEREPIALFNDGQPQSRIVPVDTAFTASDARVGVRPGRYRTHPLGRLPGCRRLGFLHQKGCVCG